MVLAVCPWFTPNSTLKESYREEEPTKHDRKISIFLSSTSLLGDFPSGLQLKGSQNSLVSAKPSLFGSPSLRVEVDSTFWSIGPVLVSTATLSDLGTFHPVLPRHSYKQSLALEPQVSSIVKHNKHLFLFTPSFCNLPTWVKTFYHQH